MARCLLFAFVALLALQASNANVVTQLVSLVRNQTQEIVNDVETTVEGLKDKVVAAAEAEYAKINATITSIVQKVESDIATAVEEAKAKGVAVEQCVVAVPTSIENLVTNVTKTAINCVVTPVEEAKNIVTTSVALVKVANSTLTGISPSEAACSSKPLLEQVTCSVQVYADAIVTLTSIASKVTSEVTEATTLVTNFEPNLVACETKAFDNAPTEAESILTTVSSCLQAAIAAT